MFWFILLPPRPTQIGKGESTQGKRGGTCRIRWGSHSAGSGEIQTLETGHSGSGLGCQDPGFLWQEIS